MRFGFSWVGAALIAATALVPLHSGGCSQKTTCITFGQAAYAQAGNQCPSSEDAFKRLTADCSGQISAVQGEGTFDGEFCCYAVVENTGDFTEPPCLGSGGVGPVGESSVAVGVGGFSTSSVGVGGAIGSCRSCTQALMNGVTGSFCSGSLDLFGPLQSCGCGACQAQCKQSLCSNGAVDMACSACLQASCNMQLLACENDP
jgi:hypothetical protein